MGEKKKPSTLTSKVLGSGDVLLSHNLSSLQRLTSVFGMGTGGTCLLILD